MAATDSLLARLANEIDESQQFIDQIVSGAEDAKRDLDSKEMELITRTRDRIAALGEQADPLRETVRIASESRARTAAIQQQLQQVQNPKRVAFEEYRTAGAYVVDTWRAGLGHEEAVSRLEMFHRVAAHQKTADNPGLLPDSIIGPVVNFIDESRPLCSAVGVNQLPGGSWSRPVVTQHTDVGPQSAEKTELVSRAMTITKMPVNPTTYGGYVNVSRQNVDWTQPQVMDILISDLAGQYAIETELALAGAIDTAAVAGPTLPASPNAANVASAIWTAAGQVYAATPNVARMVLAVSPDMLGLIGPLFAPVNPTNAYSTGFNAADFGTGVMGTISGIAVVVSAALPVNTMIVLNTGVVEAYEDRVGALQVVEPSVLGIQVAYAGYFASLILEADAIVSIGPFVGP